MSILRVYTEETIQQRRYVMLAYFNKVQTLFGI